ncbi:hypothetical protein CANCADRAFT_146635 [Tortispora caseinolytica NRRL Y-17796]|uniref:Partial AB-hydrolase lipase domain-containing protein n=1 Tax=Tortispora caseinolytica NRRL Y-17796 TaxID=767744 RepID=A0A1E4T9P4_9ASCO|nr:hypothetical protein CANCADRAFT_146635 [Tortispora caseinolytica NRRL Y-17796]
MSEDQDIEKHQIDLHAMCPEYKELAPLKPGFALRAKTTMFQITSTIFSTAVILSVLLIALSSLIFNYLFARKRRPYIEQEKAAKAARPQGVKKAVPDLAYYADLQGMVLATREILTDDGFYLQMHRILPKEGANEFESRPPVLLLHGLLASCATYCSNEDKSLAFYLVRNGFDVWIADNRCGDFRKHTTYTKHDPRMWTWDVRHMALYDLPAFVDTILNQSDTKFTKLGLVAHSQGVAQIFMSFSRYLCPELNDRVYAVCGLGPAVFTGTVLHSFFFKLFHWPTSVFHVLFGNTAVFPHLIKLRNFVPGSLYSSSAYLFFMFIFDNDDSLWDRALIGRQFIFMPIYLSSNCLRWWVGKNSVNDRGCILHPHDPNDPASKPWFNRKTAPMALWIGGKDSIVDGNKLVIYLQENEPLAQLQSVNVIPDYAHLDTLWALDSVETVASGVRDHLLRHAFPSNEK